MHSLTVKFFEQAASEWDEEELFEAAAGNRPRRFRITEAAKVKVEAAVKTELLDQAIDAIRRRFGGGAVDYGSARRADRSVPDEFRRLAEKDL